MNFIHQRMFVNKQGEVKKFKRVYMYMCASFYFLCKSFKKRKHSGPV